MLLFDANLPEALVTAFGPSFPNCIHARTAGMDEWPDERIWETAHFRGLAIVTRDRDYLNLSLRLGHPPKVILIRRGNCGNQELIALLSLASMDILSFINDSKRPILVLW